MPLMGAIYVGTSGLQTGQNALNTTAHNLSNMDTQGYVRQQVYLGNRVYNTIKQGSVSVASQQVGLGVSYDKVRQVRDYFLDLSYRKESGRAAFYATAYDAMNEVEDLLDELNDDASFHKAMTDMWSTIEELSKTPDDTAVQRMLVQNCQSFLTNASQVYQGLKDYQIELNVKIKEKVDRINELGHNIVKLNEEIQKIEVGGMESANDMRDTRNKYIDELAGLCSITYSENLYGAVSVQVEGQDFVTSENVYEIELKEDSTTGFYTPYWKLNAKTVIDPVTGLEDVDIKGAEVFKTTQLISSDRNTDIGELRSMLYVRGDKVANYTDIPVKPEIPNSADYPGDPTGYARAVADYEEQVRVYEEKVEYYNKTIAQSVCMNVQAEFDQLIHNVVTAVNDVLYKAWKDSNGTYMAADDGSPLQIFQRGQCDGYKYENGQWVHTEEIIDDEYQTDTLYSIPNLIVNPELVREAGKLKFRKEDGSVDYETAKALVDAFDSDIYRLNPNVATRCSLNTYYTNLVSQVANSGAVYKNISDNQEKTVSSLDHQREQVLGVSSDEELTNMVKFQNAFNASSRYINVIDEMLEHIINQLGTR
ncbi:MAG: flagellar hook-associated protein FlgK [Lachnospiraceae bacterium]|nr:flagellar hook-associated protein FlgK [Lachnospiraceae bacterium]